MRRRTLMALLAFPFLPVLAQAERRVLRIASSSSVATSGLFEQAGPAFEKRTGYRIKVLAVGSGRALHLAREGQADIVVSHAPEEERKFVESGFGARRHPFMRNRYLIVGPEADPARVHGAKSAGEAMRLIARTRSTFVSRGDDSGSHQAELALWKVAGLQPAGDWYQESGLGARDSLHRAATLRAYFLVDEGTWTTHRPRGLAALLTGGPELETVYALVTLNPAKVPGANHEAARAFVAWMLSPEGRRAIASLRVNGAAPFEGIAP